MIWMALGFWGMLLLIPLIDDDADLQVYLAWAFFTGIVVAGATGVAAVFA